MKIEHIVQWINEYNKRPARYASYSEAKHALNPVYSEDPNYEQMPYEVRFTHQPSIFDSVIQPSSI